MVQKYKHVVVATDVVIFTVVDNELKVLLIQMKKAPFTGKWAVPGGLVKGNESLEKGAQRILEEKAGIKNVYLEQLYTFGEVNRDPFGRVVSVAYFALVPSGKMNLSTTGEYSAVEWFSVNKLPGLAYDHKEVISTAFKRLQNKLGYSNIVYALLPKQFALSELQGMYELLLGKKFDKRNFRKKIMQLNLIKLVKTGVNIGRGRPVAVYEFKEQKLKHLKIL